MSRHRASLPRTTPYFYLEMNASESIAELPQLTATLGSLLTW